MCYVLFRRDILGNGLYFFLVVWSILNNTKYENIKDTVTVKICEKMFRLACYLVLRPASSELVMFPEFEFRTSHGTGVHLIIGRTQLSDVASFLALQTRICEI